MVKSSKRKRSVKRASKDLEDNKIFIDDIMAVEPQLQEDSKDKKKRRQKTKRNLPHKLTEFSYLLQRKALRMMKKYYKQMFEKSF